jgi:YVTN family beta-propeller protein
MPAGRARLFVIAAAGATALGSLFGAAASAVTERPAGIIRVGVPAKAVAVDPATDTGYSWAEQAGSPVNVIDLATGTVTASITVPGERGPAGQVLAVDPDTDTLYVSNDGADSVLVIDGATNTVTQTITGVQSPTAVTVGPATDTVYAALRSGAIAVIDGATGTVTGTVPAPEGQITAMAVDPSTDTVYAAKLTEGAILVIDGATDSVTTTIADKWIVYGLADDPVTDTLYAASNGPSPVTAYSGSTNTATGSLSLGNTAQGIAVNTATDTVLAAVPDAGVLALINGSADQVTGRLPLTGPDQVAVDPHTDTLLAIATGEAYAVMLQAPAITSSRAAFTVGQHRTVIIAATGTPAPDLTESGTLPGGLKLTSSGTLTGTPAAGSAGTYQITVTAANGVAPVATRAFRIVVSQRPAFVTAGHVTFRAGAEQRFTIRTTGVPVPTVTEKGKLPPGLRFTANKNGMAVIRGRAASSARGKAYLVVLTASNNVGKPVKQRLTIKVS